MFRDIMNDVWPDIRFTRSLPDRVRVPGTDQGEPVEFVGVAPRRSSPPSGARIPPPPPDSYAGPSASGPRLRTIGAGSVFGMFNIDWSLVAAAPEGLERQVMERQFGKNFRWISRDESVPVKDSNQAMSQWLALHSIRKRMQRGERFLSDSEIDTLEAYEEVDEARLGRPVTGSERADLVHFMDWQNSHRKLESKAGLRPGDSADLLSRAEVAEIQKAAAKKFEKYSESGQWQRHGWVPRKQFIDNAIEGARRDRLNGLIKAKERSSRAGKAAYGRFLKESEARAKPILQDMFARLKAAPAAEKPEIRSAAIELFHQTKLSQAGRKRFMAMMRKGGIPTQEFLPAPPKTSNEACDKLEDKLIGLAASRKMRRKEKLEDLPWGHQRYIADAVDRFRGHRVAQPTNVRSLWENVDGQRTLAGYEIFVRVAVASDNMNSSFSILMDAKGVTPGVQLDREASYGRIRRVRKA